MKQKILPAVKAAAFGGCMMFMAVSCKPGDSQITKAVTAATTAITPGVTVHVQNGIVTLGGTVRGTTTKSDLDATVKALKGVDSVIDNVSFEPPPPPPPSSTPYPGVYPDTLAERTMDTAFKYNHISGVSGSVDNGVVTLTGNAAKKDMRMILLIAHESHPKKVINKITVK
ncbi:MAG TPA: BON domain-containing protein [Chitinophagaceae bacterium]|nr:BON domain-containing protein [Chitinophagaceae bacterium]